MISDSLIQAIPDVVAFISRHGVITHHLGGRKMPFLGASGSLAGRRLGDVMHDHVATLLGRLLRRAFASRSNCESQFSVDQISYEARVSPQGAERALCVIRQLSADATSTGLRPGRAAPEGAERRGFTHRFKESVTDAALRERPLALGLILLEGLTDIGRLIDFSIADQLTTTVLRRLPVAAPGTSDVSWYVGPLGESLLAVVIEGTVDRQKVRDVAKSLCDSLAEPVNIGDATFHLSPCAGVAILGQDASQPQALVEHARAAMLESRRSGSGSVQFYSDTLRMLPAARLDIEQELRRAVAENQIGLRYVARHDLATRELVAVHAYMRWVHPLRGEVAPAEFLPIADATGLAVAVSRAALARLASDVEMMHSLCGAGVKLSFGALRQHVTSGQLERDCHQLLGPKSLAPGQLELRIAERTLTGITRPDRALGDLAKLGATLVIDEVGRSFSSLSRLAKLPLTALQIDRTLVVAATSKPSALRSCRAVAAVARALEIAAIAPGIDNDDICARMLGSGCAQGLGDLFPALADIDAPRIPKKAAG